MRAPGTSAVIDTRDCGGAGCAARSEFAQCLALTAIANIGGKQMAEAQLAPSVTKLLLAK
jgi:hypothetical protein